MKKIAMVLLFALAALLIPGCDGRDAPSPTALKPGQAENEILTYTPVDPNRTTLLVSRTGNIFIRDLAEAFMEENPDVQIVTLDITGGNDQSRPMAEWVLHGCAPDVMFINAGGFTGAQSAAYFENLSTNPVIERYEAQALDSVAVDANIYWLPGPSQIACMHYNKTLFDRYGWQIPKTFDEFVALCARINEDTGGAVQPWNPNAKYESEFLLVTEAFVYNEVFGGLKNRAWYEDFLDGKATFAGHMEPYYQAVQTLIDEGLLREEHFSYSATSRGKEFAAGEIAMINQPVSIMENSEDVFGCMPFPTTRGEDGYVCSMLNCVVGVPKKARDEATKKAVDRFIDFVSTQAGQRALTGDRLMMSNVIGVDLPHGELLAALGPTLEGGRLFTALSFSEGEKKPGFSLHKDALAMTRGEKTAAQCLADVDEKPFLTPEESVQKPPVVGRAGADFTILETSCFLADMYRETAKAQIGLIVNNAAYRGNLMRIFAGDLSSADVTVLKPRSLAGGSTLVKAEMTGRQLLDALNHPVDEGENSVYAFSGLKGEIAPWAKAGEKYRALTLADGSPIDEDATYTAAFWAGTVDEAYIARVVQTYPETFEEMLTRTLQETKAIVPAGDGRIKLIW